jgi:hypothetical protein
MVATSVANFLAGATEANGCRESARVILAAMDTSDAVEHAPSQAEELRLWQEAYQGEVLGEAYFTRMRDLAVEEDQRYKIDHLVGLERSTKEMLRPSLLSRGLPTEPDPDVLATMANLTDYDWTGMLEGVRPVAAQFLAKYRRLAELVGIEDRPVTDALIDHEVALDDFCRLELAGDRDHSLDRISSLAHFRLPGAAA